MENLEKEINIDFLKAYKSGETNKKDVIGILKESIILDRKAFGKTESNDEEIVKIVSKMIKSRTQSIEEFRKGKLPETDPRLLLEFEEIETLSKYMPVQFNDNEIEAKLKSILEDLPTSDNINKLNGMAIGAFNKKYQGKANVNDIKRILATL